MQKVSMYKLVSIAEPIHMEWLNTIEEKTSHLSPSEQVAIILIMLDVMRKSLVEAVGEEQVAKFERLIEEASEN